MTTAQPRFRNVRPQIFLLCLTAFLAGTPAYSQQTVPPTESYVRIGREFLRALYPELNGKKYTVTLETPLSYDDNVVIVCENACDQQLGFASALISH
jgi:hypothetical protein